MSPSRHRVREAVQAESRALARKSADAELSSLSSTLEEVGQRLGEMVSQLQDAGEEELSGDLLSVQKTIETAIRRLCRRR